MKNSILLFALFAMPLASKAAENDQPAENTLRKAIRSAGGKRFNSIKAPTMWMETGTYYGTGQGVPFVAQYATYWPKRWYRQWVEGQFSIGIAGEQVTVFRGDSNEGQKLSGPMLKAALHHSQVAWAQLLYPLTEDEYTLSNIPGIDVDGNATVGIKAVHKSGSEVSLYFDKRTFLLKKTEAMVPAREYGGKMVESETVFSEHKRFGGVLLPGNCKILYDGKLFVESERKAIKTHATIDPAWFGTKGPARVR